MALVVTGLSQDGDTSALRSGLEGAGFTLDTLQVIEPDDSEESVAHGLVGDGLITSDGGAGVPGINSGDTQRVFFRNESMPDRLGDLEIPDSEVDNYVEALERGRSVVAFFAKPETIDKVEQIFKDAGLLNVRRY
jgi:hypothetical protein